MSHASTVGALVEWLLGYPEKALASIADALALAERIAHPFTLSLVFINSSVVYLNRREPERALRQLEGRVTGCGASRAALMVNAKDAATFGVLNYYAEALP
jgi:hypothetical protein